MGMEIWFEFAGVRVIEGSSYRGYAVIAGVIEN